MVFLPGSPPRNHPTKAVAAAAAEVAANNTMDPGRCQPANRDRAAPGLSPELVKAARFEHLPVALRSVGNSPRAVRELLGHQAPPGGDGPPRTVRGSRQDGLPWRPPHTRPAESGTPMTANGHRRWRISRSPTSADVLLSG